MAGKFLGLSFSDWGSVASFAGLAVSVWVLIAIRDVRRFYEIRARVPELMDKLIACASNISEIHLDYDNRKPAASLEIARVEVVVDNIKGKVGKKIKNNADLLKNDIRSYKEKEERSSLWVVYVSLQKLISQIEEIKTDLNWQR